MNWAELRDKLKTSPVHPHGTNRARYIWADLTVRRGIAWLKGHDLAFEDEAGRFHSKEEGFHEQTVGLGSVGYLFDDLAIGNVVNRLKWRELQHLLNQEMKRRKAIQARSYSFESLADKLLWDDRLSEPEWFPPQAKVSQRRDK